MYTHDSTLGIAITKVGPFCSRRETGTTSRSYGIPESRNGTWTARCRAQRSTCPPRALLGRLPSTH